VGFRAARRHPPRSRLTRTGRLFRDHNYRNRRERQEFRRRRLLVGSLFLRHAGHQRGEQSSILAAVIPTTPPPRNSRSSQPSAQFAQTVWSISTVPNTPISGFSSGAPCTDRSVASLVLLRSRSWARRGARASIPTIRRTGTPARPCNDTSPPRGRLRTGALHQTRGWRLRALRSLARRSPPPGPFNRMPRRRSCNSGPPNRRPNRARLRRPPRRRRWARASQCGTRRPPTCRWRCGPRPVHPHLSHRSLHKPPPLHKRNSCSQRSERSRSRPASSVRGSRSGRRPRDRPCLLPRPHHRPLPNCTHRG
jgi:hypothetical protein